jgi:hypothetical protein
MQIVFELRSLIFKRKFHLAYKSPLRGIFNITVRQVLFGWCDRVILETCIKPIALFF